MNTSAFSDMSILFYSKELYSLTSNSFEHQKNEQTDDSKKQILSFLSFLRIHNDLHQLFQSIFYSYLHSKNIRPIHSPNQIFDLLFSSFYIFTFLAVSYNQSSFCPNASWNSTGTTFANNGTVGSYPNDIFITTNSTIYVPTLSNQHIIVWSETSQIPAINISVNASSI